MKITCNCIADLDKVANAVLKQYPNEKIFALRGAMGAGKTTFMQAMVRCLGSQSVVSSPTFSLVNEYELPNQSLIYHFDFYRIKNFMEAIQIGFEEYLYSENYCFIEWAEKVEELLPTEIININIQVNEKDLTRLFSF